MKLKALVVSAFVIISAFYACKKDAGSTHLKVKLTDAPASYEEVNVDLREVNIKMESDSSAWISLQTAAGIYNVLELQDGIDTLISEAILPAGKVKEIRLVLGSENSIKAGGQFFPLTIPSGSESGLKIKVDKTLASGVDSLTIDFDAGLSVKFEQEAFRLRPVLKIVD